MPLAGATTFDCHFAAAKEPRAILSFGASRKQSTIAAFSACWTKCRLTATIQHRLDTRMLPPSRDDFATTCRHIFGPRCPPTALTHAVPPVRFRSLLGPDFLADASRCSYRAHAKKNSRVRRLDSYYGAAPPSLEAAFTLIRHEFTCHALAMTSMMPALESAPSVRRYGRCCRAGHDMPTTFHRRATPEFNVMPWVTSFLRC